MLEEKEVVVATDPGTTQGELAEGQSSKGVVFDETLQISHGFAEELADAFAVHIELNGGETTPAVHVDKQQHGASARPGRSQARISLSILEQVHDFGPGGRVWDAALALGSHLVKRFGDKEGGMTGLTAIEIGAGTGLCGIVSSMLGATCCLTDKEYVLPILWANARINLADQVDRGELWAETLEWGQRLPKRMLRCSWDFILCSDVVGCGDEALFPPLMKTLRQMASQATVVLMSYKPRAQFERVFFDSASQHFSIRRLDRITLPEGISMESYHSPVEILELRMLSTSTVHGSPFVFDYDFDQEEDEC